MTKREGAIITAFTGKLVCGFPAFHEYVEEIMGRPVFTHEFADKDIAREIEDRSRQDFMKLCEGIS